MISGFIAQKKSMTSIFTPEGKMLAVTVLKALPVKVSRLRTIDKDGYQAVQVQFDKKSLCEFDLIGESVPELNAEIAVNTVLAPGDKIYATGKSKGRGFAGVIKRYGFHRQPVTGGQSDRVRAPGSIGAQTPGKVIRGKKLPGHYGNATATVTNLKVVSIDKDQNLLYVSGAIPGHFNSWIVISKK